MKPESVVSAVKLTAAISRWTAVPAERRKTIIELLEMESQGGGWIPNEDFKEQPERAGEQADDIERLIELLKTLETLRPE